MEKIQLLFDGDVRGMYTGIDCAKWLCGKQVIWTGFEKRDIDLLLANDNLGYNWFLIDEIIDNAECKLITGERFTLQWADGSIYAVEDSALEDFTLQYLS